MSGEKKKSNQSEDSRVWIEKQQRQQNHQPSQQTQQQKPTEKPSGDGESSDKK